MEYDQPTNPYAPTSELGDQDPFAMLRDRGPVEEVNPFVSIWFRPRVTVRWIVHSNPTLHLWLLAGLAGIADSFDNAVDRDAGDVMSLPAILALVIALGPLFGIVQILIYAALIRWTGKWLGGIAESEDVRAALAWGGMPAVASLLLWAIQISLFGNTVFESGDPLLKQTGFLDVVSFLITLGEAILGIWYLVLVCNTVAEVQGYQSAWKGLGNLILPILVIALPLMAIGALLFSVA